MTKFQPHVLINFVLNQKKCNNHYNFFLVGRPKISRDITIVGRSGAVNRKLGASSRTNPLTEAIIGIGATFHNAECELKVWIPLSMNYEWLLSFYHRVKTRERRAEMTNEGYKWSDNVSQIWSIMTTKDESSEKREKYSNTNSSCIVSNHSLLFKLITHSPWSSSTSVWRLATSFIYIIDFV